MQAWGEVFRSTALQFCLVTIRRKVGLAGVAITVSKVLVYNFLQKLDEKNKRLSVLKGHITTAWVWPLRLVLPRPIIFFYVSQASRCQRKIDRCRLIRAPTAGPMSCV